MTTKKACKIYQSLSKEEKYKKRQYGYKNDIKIYQKRKKTC